MAESPPHVRVSTTGVKTDFADAQPRSERTPAPADTLQVVETDVPPETDEEPARDRPDS